MARLRHVAILLPLLLLALLTTTVDAHGATDGHRGPKRSSTGGKHDHHGEKHVRKDRDGHRPEHRTHRTTVSFTFTGSYNGQDAAASILAGHGLAGTFYVNSGYLDYPGYLSVDQLRSITRAGSEIGGGSLKNTDLATMSREEVHETVCDDRATLTALGLPVTSFAYPRGRWTYDAQLAAHECGYNTGRQIAGLKVSEDHCPACPLAENIPAANAYQVRTTSPGSRVSDLKSLVERAELHGGGWLVLAFSNVCICPERSGAITPYRLDEFARWISERPSVSVRTVDQVVGGELRDAVGTPLERFMPRPSPRATPVPLSRIPAWTVLGVQVGQAQILLTGLLLSVAVVMTYRVATRSNRYGK